MSSWLKLLLALGFVVAVSQGKGIPKLELASVLIRHGDRSPMAPPPPNYTRAPVSLNTYIKYAPKALAPPSLHSEVSSLQDNAWPQGFRQLTVRGMKQMYYLGELLRQRYVTHTYPGFIAGNYTKAQVYMFSTNDDRTLMSAQVLLAALFPPEGKWKFRESLNWQPVPVHTRPRTEDILLSGHVADLPTYHELRKRDYQTEESVALEKEHQKFFRKLENFTGMKKVDLTNIRVIGDTIFAEHTSGYGFPEWLQPGELESLKKLATHLFSFAFNTPEKLQLIASTWVGKVRNDILGKMAGDPTLNQSKLFLYSAHGTTVATMMSAFGVWDGIIPNCASAFLIELFSDEDGYFVQMSYRRDTYTSDIHPIPVPGCGGNTQCSLEEFQALTEPFLEERLRQCPESEEFQALTEPLLSAWKY